MQILASQIAHRDHHAAAFGKLIEQNPGRPRGSRRYDNDVIGGGGSMPLAAITPDHLDIFVAQSRQPRAGRVHQLLITLDRVHLRAQLCQDCGLIPASRADFKCLSARLHPHCLSHGCHDVRLGDSL